MIIMNQQEQINEQKFFVEWLKLKGNSYNRIECPIKMNDYFLNLKDPLKYNQNEEKNHFLREKQQTETKMKIEKDSAQKISKTINKKVVTRDNIEYKFGLNVNPKRGFEKFEFKQKRQKQMKEDDEKFKKRMEEFERTFKHGKSDFHQANKLQQDSIDLQVIKSIENPDFEKFKGTQFYDLFFENQQINEKYLHSSYNLSEDDEIDRSCERIKLNMTFDESYFSQKSELIMFDPNELKFWKNPVPKKSDEIQILNRCKNLSLYEPTYIDLMDYGSGKLTSQILDSIYKLKKTHEAEQRLDKNNENLQQEYNKAKSQLEFFRQFRMKNKNNRISYKITSRQAQTLQNLQDKSFDSYFEEDTKEILLKLSELTQMRQTLMKEKSQAQKKISLVNMYHEIKKYCFKLLSVMFRGEDFPQYFDLVQIEDKKIAQRLMLECIYKEFNSFKQTEVDGIKKIDILKRYLAEREKNERMIEVIEAGNLK